MRAYMRKSTLVVTIVALAVVQVLWADVTAEWGQGNLAQYGLSLEDLSHQYRTIRCDATLRLAIQVPEPMGLYYKVSDSSGQAIYKDNFEFSTDNRNEFWALIQFPEKGRYSIRVYMLDGGFKRLLSYEVECSSGYKDGGNPVYVGGGFYELLFDAGNLASQNLLISTGEPLGLSFKNDRFLLKYIVGITDTSLKPEFIQTTPNRNNLLFYRYPDRENGEIYLYFQERGYYIVRVYAHEVLGDKGGLLSEYVIHTTGEHNIEGATKEVFQTRKPQPDKDWYESQVRPDTAELDESILNTPLELRNDPRKLVSYFESKAQSEYEKARAAYVWLQNFIRYDREMASTRVQTSQMWVYRSSIEGMLDLRRAVCNGYARLFALFCRLMDMEAVVIEGRLKGWAESHAWNAVLIDGTWRLLDATGCESGGFIREYTFLSNPYEFIDTRYPSESFWQLIDDPLTEEEAREQGFFEGKRSTLYIDPPLGTKPREHSSN